MIITLTPCNHLTRLQYHYYNTKSWILPILSLFRWSKYFIVDYSTTFSIYIAEFLCALLCSASIALACLLFTIRKSETAGKPALSWKLQFAIRCAIGFTISVFGTFMYIQLVNEDYTSGTPPYMYTIIAFIITAYVLAILCGFLLNAGINNMTSYRANTDNIDYIRLSAQNNYYMTEYENLNAIISEHASIS